MSKLYLKQTNDIKQITNAPNWRSLSKVELFWPIEQLTDRTLHFVKYWMATNWYWAYNSIKIVVSFIDLTYFCYTHYSLCDLLCAPKWCERVCLCVMFVWGWVVLWLTWFLVVCDVNYLVDSKDTLNKKVPRDKVSRKGNPN